MPLSVYVVQEDNAHQVEEMFLKEGSAIVYELEEADLVCFTGGADVSPHLYHEHMHNSTFSNIKRDDKEMAIYNEAFDLGIPMVGICRGGQFLNVMNGGRLYQDVDGHCPSTGTHKAWIPGNSKPIDVTSTHHQMMSPNADVECRILLTAQEARSKSYMSSVNSQKFEHKIYPVKTAATDIEVLYYPGTHCLCFQPHPEYQGEHVKDTTEIFFLFLENYLLPEFKFSETA